MTDRQPTRRRLWRTLAASSLLPMIALWALWRDVCQIEASGVARIGGARSLAEWALVSAATAVVVSLLFAPSRALRLLACTIHSLVVSIAFGAAVVLAVMHGFGGPDGSLAAPAWALVALGLAAAVCVASLLATAALVVDEVRAADAEEERLVAQGRGPA